MLNFKKREYPYPEPEWTAENMNRKKGDTTFKQCGWCEHASCGSCRYGCYLSTSCSLMKSYGLGENVYWDTPCIVKMLGEDDLKSIIKNKKWEISSALETIKNIKNEIKTINNLQVKNKPPLPDNRIDDFNIGEIVWVFIEQDCIWARGIVVSGYRTHDGCVSYVLDNYPESKKGWGCGVSVPCILKDWEYNYFKNNISDFKIWLELSNRKYNGEYLDINSYYKAMELLDRVVGGE